MAKNKKLIVIGGPTAAGKSELAAFVSRQISGEIINADSMQVYKGMDIGTNKEIPGGIRSWGFDIVSPDEEFNLSHYQKYVEEAIEDILSREKVPVMVGGSGLYIDSVVKGYKLEEVKPNLKLRRELGDLSAEELRYEASRRGVTLESLNEADKDNPHRLIRLIEKAESKKGNQHNNEPKYDALLLYPEFNREDLFEKINQRAKSMIEKGMIEEVQKLLDSGYTQDIKALNSTGYKQVLEYLNGEIESKKKLVEKIAQAHRNYAKRQITWFEGEGREYKLHKVNKQNVLEIIHKFLNK